MVRKLHCLLLALAMLLPPGVCVCHAGEPGCGASRDHDHSDHATSTSDADNCCGDSDQSDVGGSPMPHEPADHAPRCPAGEVVGRSLTTQEMPTTAPLALAFDLVIAERAVTAPSHGSAPPACMETADPPLYLTLRVL